MPTNVIVTLNHVECASCGLLFGITDDFQQRRRSDHGAFLCPLGHSNVYRGESEEERLKRELKAKNDEISRQRAFADQREERIRELHVTVRHERSRVNGYKGVVARTKRKIAAGRCPCCSHQFKDLERHMKTQHPKFDPDKAADVMAGKSEAKS